MPANPGDRRQAANGDPPPWAPVLYDERFFEAGHARSLASARAVVPIVLAVCPARRVLDVGSGRGEWLSVFRDLGVPHLHGVDGPWLDPGQLWIEPSCFTAVDLEGPFLLHPGFDRAVCLEVAEHLSDLAGCRLVEALCRAAPAVLFSAAATMSGCGPCPRR